MLTRCFDLLVLVTHSKPYITCDVKLKDVYYFARSLDPLLCVDDTQAIL